MRAASLLLVLNLLPAVMAEAAVEARSAHFRVITSLDPAIAETAARELENIRGAYRSLGLAEDRSASEPLAVLIFRDVPEFELQTGHGGGRPGLTRGLHQQGVDRDFIAIAWDGAGSPTTALAHEYAHQLLPGNLPLWFREGMAEYLSASERVGAVMSVGGALPKWMAPLLSEPWIPLQEVLAAETHSPLLGRRNFYPQCWLLVHWLASREPDLKNLRRLMQASVGGDAGVLEQQLREHLRQPWSERTSIVTEPVDASVRLRPIEGAESEFWIADMQRELGRRHEARRRLESLDQAHPLLPEISEALGAIAMDQGRYEEAEQHLASAVARGSRNARTHYRYSLLLLRPVEPPQPERGQRALSHARMARLADSSEPRYLLTEAQASMVVGEWEAAAALLAKLDAVPGWRDQAAVELGELARRKQDLLRREPPPRLLAAHHVPAALAAGPDIARPVKPRPGGQSNAVAAPVPQAAQAWPPPGTILLAGRIGGVECTGGKKFVTVNSPLFRTRLLTGDTVKLYYPPLKWRELPCGTRGWTVNAAYRPVPGLEGARGVLVALLF